MTDRAAHREVAAQEVARLTAQLAALPQEGVVAELVELGGHLERAIRAFHMEAIRFRAYSMRRLIKLNADALPADVQAAMDRIVAALEAAGFQTRSVSPP
jgi:hypothetical protein